MSLSSYIVGAFLLLTSIRAFNLPGLVPVNYCKAGLDNKKTCKYICTPTVFTTPSQIEAYYLFNHVDLEITYHSSGGEDWAGEFGDNVGRIIFAKIKQASINHQDPAHIDCKARNTPLHCPSTITGDETFGVTYTYIIKFIKNNTINWSSRWDYILKSIPQTNVHFFFDN